MNLQLPMPNQAGNKERRMGWQTNLVIRLVLPTLWSPSSTIFVRFGGAEEKSGATGDVEVSIGTGVFFCLFVYS
jgi:hypothetical protein